MEQNKELSTKKQCDIHVVMPRFFFQRFVFTYPDKTKGYTVRKAENKDDAINDFNSIFPELNYYRIDFLNEV